MRPTRERFHPLNVSLTALPLHVSLAPLSVGSWQLMQMLDASLTTQQAIGATDKDTDDVIRLLAETPMWLLGITFVVSFVHMLVSNPMVVHGSITAYVWCSLTSWR